MLITSTTNELVKNTAKLLQKKHREETGLFLLEGEKCIYEAINYHLKIERIFTLDGFNNFDKENIEIIKTNEAVLTKISESKSAPKCVAVAEQIKYDIEQIKDLNNILLLDSIKDAGNLGTILRSAVAFGVDGIILYGNSIDIYNPKCVRASVGNLWKLPILYIKDLNIIKNYFSDFERIGTLPKSNNSEWLNNFKLQKNKNLIMFGSEAEGLSDELKNYATRNITIEISKEVESLNLASSVSVILYQLFINK